MTSASPEFISAVVGAVLKAVSESQPAAAPAPAIDAQWMPIWRFAKAFGFSTRSVSRWCGLGMPHVGKGRNTRIEVAKARAWLDDDGPKRALRRQGHAAHARSLQ